MRIPGDTDSDSDDMRTSVPGYADKLAARLLSVGFCMSVGVALVNVFVEVGADRFPH